MYVTFPDDDDDPGGPGGPLVTFPDDDDDPGGPGGPGGPLVPDPPELEPPELEPLELDEKATRRRRDTVGGTRPGSNSPVVVLPPAFYGAVVQCGARMLRAQRYVRCRPPRAEVHRSRKISGRWHVQPTSELSVRIIAETLHAPALSTAQVKAKFCELDPVETLVAVLPEPRSIAFASGIDLAVVSPYPS